MNIAYKVGNINMSIEIPGLEDSKVNIAIEGIEFQATDVKSEDIPVIMTSVKESFEKLQKQAELQSAGGLLS